MIDLHAHLLPGFDDGVRSLEEARELARAASARGVTAIAATPHVRSDYPTTAARMERGVASLQADFAAAGIAIDVVAGGELAIDRLWELGDDEIRRFTYAGAGRYLLVEFPYSGWPQLAEQTVASLRASGIRPVLAHPERNDAVQSAPRRLEPLVAAGALVQLTAGSVTGLLGAHPRDASNALLERGLAHLLASDAHGPHVPRAALADAVAALGDDALARRLTVDVPAAIIAGDDV